MINAKYISCILIPLLLGTVFCAAPTQQSKSPSAPNYPPVIEASPTRQQAAEEAWNAFLSEYRLPYVKPELEPILYSPRSLPSTLANQINIRPSDEKTSGPIDENKIKDYLRRFIDHYHAVLCGDQRASTLSLKDISLIQFSADSNMFHATYQQMNYPFPVENNFGKLKITVSKAGALLQLSSTIIPPMEFPARPKVEAAELSKKLVGREFTYSNFAGQPMSYKVAQESEISIKDLIIYPQVTEQKIILHLAYPVEVGRGMTWTVFVDAITGEEIASKQNFQT